MGSLKFGELLNKNMKNPSDISLSNSNIFGLDCDFDASNIVILPVPWDVTTSYRRGTSMGPESLKISSSQIEIYDEYLGNIWKAGIFCEKVAASWVAWNDRLSYVSKKIISGLEDGDDINSHAFHLKYVNAQSEEFFSEVLSRIERLFEHGKFVIGLGGDHSVSESFIKATSNKYKSFSILHLDAHLDMREDYEGFEGSHASVIFNCLQKNDELNLVQVGARAFSEEELEYATKHHDKVSLFTDRAIKSSLYRGRTWHDICLEITEQCKEKLYISFDIDVLMPSLCPDTGTPVPGGLSVEHIFYLIELLVRQGKTIVGADLVEISGNEHTINMIVASRVLYKLCGYMARSQGLI
jgi:agmatinase